MEKPVHDDQEHDDGEQTGGGLQIERWDIFAERTDNSDGN